MPIAIDTQNLHPSTEACLEALQWLHERAGFERILDMGCGSGILSIVAATVWPDAQVLAADIAEKAVADCRHAVAAQGLQGHITVIRSDGFSASETRGNAPYDLIMGNLLAETHLKLAPDIKKHLKKGGFYLLSGALEWLAGDVQEAYTTLGFEIIKEITVSPWVAVIACHTDET